MAPVHRPEGRRDLRLSSSIKRSGYQEKRRNEALERQRNARQDATSHARELADKAFQMDASGGAEPEEVDMDVREGEGQTPERMSTTASTSTSRHKTTPRRKWSARSQDLYYAKQMMQPDWLVDIPPNLGTEWLVMPRPEGQRCLVISGHGQTVSRQRSGAVLHSFPSALPNGSRATGAGSDIFCILDCIFHEPDSTYYVIDLLCWKGYSLYSCTAEFRLYWVNTKLSEADVGARPGDQHRFAFAPVAALPCTPDGLRAAHSGPVPFRRDGCYFLHKQGHYTLGSSPLALVWKDAECSPFHVDTDADGLVPQWQTVILEYRMDRTVATADDPPDVLGKMPDAFVTQMGDKLGPGKLLRFTIRDGGVQFLDGRPVGADLHYEGPASPRRARADPTSKVLFQYNARRDATTLQDLIDAANSEQMEDA